MKLLFLYLAEKMSRDEKGAFYSSFNSEVWDRYLSLTNELHAVLSIRPNIIKSEVASRSLTKIDEKKVKLHSVPINTASIWTFVNPILYKKRIRIIENAIKEADAVIIRTPSSQLINLCKKHNKPYAVEVVGCPWDSLWNHSWKARLFALNAYLDAKKVIKDSPYVLYVTNEFLQRRYPTNGKNINCSNVSLLPFADNILENRIKKIAEYNGFLTLVTTAALDVKYKGQQYVIEALGILKKAGITNFEYWLIGGGNSNYLKKEAKKWGVESQVKIIGQLEHSNVFELLTKADLYIQPSLQEGLPRAVIEAMSLALPCIGSDIAGIPELLEKDCLFKAAASNEIANLLRAMNKQYLTRLAKYNFAKAKEYDIDVLKEKRKTFYIDFLKNTFTDD